MLSAHFFRDCRENYAKIYPISPSKVEENSDECCICLSPLRKYKKIYLSGCAHKLHYKCVKSWLSTGNNTCPLCLEDQTKLKKRLSL